MSAHLPPGPGCPCNIVLSATSGNMISGSPVTTQVTVNLNAGPASCCTRGLVTLSYPALPSGVTATFSPNSGTPTFSSRLTFGGLPNPVPKPGTYNIVISASGVGAIEPRSGTYSLGVTQIQ
jgi:hypothetical protein